MSKCEVWVVLLTKIYLQMSNQVPNCRVSKGKKRILLISRHRVWSHYIDLGDWSQSFRKIVCFDLATEKKNHNTLAKLAFISWPGFPHLRSFFPAMSWCNHHHHHHHHHHQQIAECPLNCWSRAVMVRSASPAEAKRSGGGGDII